MQVRPFGWRDITALHRHRNNSVYLNISLLLTRGPLMMPGALLSYLAPSMGVYTCVSDGHEEQHAELIGQAIHQSGSPFAHLTFVTPDSALDSPALSSVVEYLIKTSGERGALHTPHPCYGTAT